MGLMTNASAINGINIAAPEGIPLIKMQLSQYILLLKRNAEAQRQKEQSRGLRKQEHKKQ